MFPPTVQDWEIIEPASFDQLGRGTATGPSSQGRVGERGEGEGEGEGRGSPRSVSSRERWRRAIEQQIMLQRMEKENQSLLSKSQHTHRVLLLREFLRFF